jgi:hypothetical protein
MRIKSYIVSACCLLFVPASWAQKESSVLEPEEPPAQAPEAASPEEVMEPPRPWAKGITKDKQDAALAHFVRGNDFFDKYQFARALEHYRKALEIWDHPGIHFNEAICLTHLERTLDAYYAFEQSLAHEGAALEPDKVVEAKRYRKLLRKQLAAIVVASDTPEAEIYVDDKRLGTEPRHEFLTTAGAHTIVARKNGLLTQTLRLDLRAGTTRSVKIRLEAPTRSETIERRRWPNWMPWTVLGSGAALGLAGIAFHAAAQSRYDDYDAAIARCGEEQGIAGGCNVDQMQELGELESEARRFRGAAIFSYSVGATALVAGAVLVLLNRPTTEVREMVSVSSTTGGAMMYSIWHF